MSEGEHGVLGCCSWSLRPEGPEDLCRQVVEVGLREIQIALDPLRDGTWDEAATVRCVSESGLRIRSGMMGMEGEDYTTLESIHETGGVRPDVHWAANLAAAKSNAQLARRLGLTLVTLHAGFLPETRGDSERTTMVERLRALVDAFDAEGVSVAFETGQETAATLLDVLDELDRPAAGVNFDPANMILYGTGDPVRALASLAPHVRQIHVKDATATKVPGTWGTEVPVGEGDVAWPAFFDIVSSELPGVDLMIEREAGEDRVGDMRRARDLVAELSS